jgi:hypothetical protein
MTRAALALVVALAALVAGCGFGGGGDSENGAAPERSTTRVEVIRSLGKGDGFDPQAIYKEEAPGVVTVVSLFDADSLTDLQDSSGGVGSGFVIDADGEIATRSRRPSAATTPTPTWRC